MASLTESEDWAANEFGGARLGDARRTERLIQLARRMAQSAHCSFPQSLSPAELKAAYRFFDNDEVDTDGILSAHIGQTLGRMHEQASVVLAVQDTTEFNLTHLKCTDGLGYTSDEDVRGFFMHSMLAVSPEGLPLGVLGLKIWARDIEQLGKRHLRRQRPIAEKESYKWLEGVQHLNMLKAHCPANQLVGVCDREADVYELFVAERAAGVDWLVRASWDRRVDHPQKHLWGVMSSAQLLGKTDLLVPAAPNRPARTARLSIRAAPVQLRAPQTRPGLGPVNVYAVWAVEADPPKSIKKPIEWMLLTSVPTLSSDDALERLAWYARRWTIESWHRVLKSGCQVEARQFGSLERFKRATALFAVISWRIQYGSMLSRLQTDIPCSALLQSIEWKTLYCRTHRTAKPPSEPPTLNQAVVWIAKLGGYLNRKSDRPPGTTVLWRGFLILYASTEVFRLFYAEEERARGCG